jgi:hypothetical protein
MLIGEGRDLEFEINGCQYNRYYLLTNGIYLEWGCFVQSIHMLPDAKRGHFAERQEAVRKDVERCFGVLQARFAILKNPCRQWSMEVINDIIFAYCILHNMIVEDEEGVPGLEDIITDLQRDVEPLERSLSLDNLIASTKEIENVDTHYSLPGDLIEHLWAI